MKISKKLIHIKSRYKEGFDAIDIAKQLGISKSTVERQLIRMEIESQTEGHDTWVLSTLASGDPQRIKELQEYWPRYMGCPIPMSPEVFQKLHRI